VRVILDNPGFTIDADEPDFVIAGLDFDLTYARLRTAVLGILRGARFVATNADANLPMESGEIWPGAGSIIAAIQIASGQAPVAVLGKPETHLLELALDRTGADRAHSLMVGDRADTDILAGKRAGMPTALVLTGITTEAELKTLPEEMRPDYVFNNLDELVSFILQKEETD
jgi:4-nitrophenyl phosphatase